MFLFACFVIPSHSVLLINPVFPLWVCIIRTPVVPASPYDSYV